MNFYLSLSVNRTFIISYLQFDPYDFKNNVSLYMGYAFLIYLESLIHKLLIIPNPASIKSVILLPATPNDIPFKAFNADLIILGR